MDFWILHTFAAKFDVNQWKCAQLSAKYLFFDTLSGLFLGHGPPVPSPPMPHEETYRQLVIRNLQ